MPDNSSCKIISKYFTSKSSMDESLSDFQEKKIIYIGPKNKKLSKSKASSSKKDKQIKGQRDIRTLVESRKNELLTYNKDFDEVCRNSGLDVDSEQLQIAIALSKSLQDSDLKQAEVNDQIKPLTAKERSRKIKSTLQEYGFKVPNAVLPKNKRRVTNKNSKLLNTSESEKRKAISCKYLKILENNCTIPKCSLFEWDHSDKKVYHKTTNILYSQIKNIDEFYVPSLIEKTTHRTYLLKDWSEIPGRPLSPTPEISNYKFEEFSFSQQELDCLLSHSLQEAQEIIKSKNIKSCKQEAYLDIEKTTIEGKTNLQSKINSEQIINKSDNNNQSMEHDVQYICTTQGDRSLSPDLFEEDDYSKIAHASDELQNSEIKSSMGSDKTSFMDLTECVGNVNNIQGPIGQYKKLLAFENHKTPYDSSLETESFVSFGHIKDEPQNIIGHKITSQSKIFQINCPEKTLSHETFKDINDLMEVTDCVVSEFIHNNKNSNKLITESICLDKNVQVRQDFIKTNPSNVNIEDIENIDLTQASDNTIILNETNRNDLLSSEEVNNESMVPISVDLTQSSNSNEDFPIVKISDHKDHELFDATIILCDNNVSDNVLNEKNHIPNDDKLQEDILCLIEEIPSPNIISQDTNKSFNTNYSGNVNNGTYESSDSIIMKDDENKNVHVENNIKDQSNLNSVLNINDRYETWSDNNIDLTQSPESQNMSEHQFDLTQSLQSPNITNNIACLGKQNNISIDYDELYDNVIMTVSPNIIQDQENFMRPNSKHSIIDIIDDDKHQSVIRDLKQEEYQKCIQSIGCIQETKENYSSDPKRNVHSSIRVETLSMCSANNSYLPNVNVKNVNNEKEAVTEKSPLEQSPIKMLENNRTFGTPVDDKYIIKTQNVTPMLDYESMSTPVRNKELEKYGIKPFNRKRAIQLLTYIYNQTHPVVENCAIDDMPCTSKKIKLNQEGETEQSCSTKRQKSCRKLEEKETENNVYVETKVNPDIKKIECCPDDWVFQTREKAKVHSCRVPLHIAFHNYVSCRHFLRAAILRYEPVNIDIIHKDLITSGYRYNPKELLKFLDKKCVTVKTTENNARNRQLNKS